MTWWRVEGACRDPQVTEGLAARIADPLWTLARQWQVGEFAGEDAASPVLVSAEVVHTTLSAFAPGSGKGAPNGPVAADRPLEVLVEQEAVDDDIRSSLEFGWLLLRDVRPAVPEAVAPLRARYKCMLPVDDGSDPAGRAQLDLIAARSLDGARLASELTAGGPRAIRQLVTELSVPREQQDRLVAILESWHAGVADLVRIPEAASCWRTEPLEYRFRVAAPFGEGEVTLAASEYRGGTLDWYHFRRAGGVDPIGASGTPRLRQIKVLPTPLRFLGMPAARFWEIEDDLVSFGDLAAGPADLVRAVVSGFAAVYGDDWMVMPCTLPAGSLARVRSLVVHDDYGASHRIRATAVLDGPGRVWRFFELEGDDGPDAPAGGDRRAPLMLLAPALADVEEGPPLERVDFVRDQAANLAWAIERLAPGGSGRPADRDAVAAPSDAPESGDAWSYQAYAPVRANWIPFTPVRSDDGVAQVHLRRARMAVPPPGMDPADLLPKGRLLDARRPMRVHEEAIPDAGLRIDRRYQRTRSVDGRVHVWVGRRVRTGAWPARSRFATDRLLRNKSAGG